MEKFKILSSLIVSLALFLGGLMVLLLKIPFWGTFLGVPLIIIGASFLILTFDKLNQLTLEEES